MESATACAIDVALAATSSATFAIVESSIVFIAVAEFISVEVLRVLTICVTMSSSPSPSAKPDPSSKASPTAIIFIRVAFIFCASISASGFEVVKSKSDGRPKLLKTVTASPPAASTIVVSAETYLESFEAVKVTVTASPVRVSTPPSATTLTPLLSSRLNIYCPSAFVVVSAMTVPLRSRTFTEEPLT